MYSNGLLANFGSIEMLLISPFEPTHVHVHVHIALDALEAHFILSNENGTSSSEDAHLHSHWAMNPCQLPVSNSTNSQFMIMLY